MAYNPRTVYQEAPGSGSTTLDANWLDGRNETPSWEETLRDPKIQRLLRKKIPQQQEKTHERRGTNLKSDPESLSRSFSTATLRDPFPSPGISMKDKKVLYKKRQKENRRIRRQENDAATQERFDEELSQTLDFEIKYMKAHKLPLYQSFFFITSLNDLDRLIRSFLLDSKQEQLSLCAMDSSVRSIVKDLLVQYELNYSVLDRKDQKHLALYKTKRSGIPDWDKKLVQHDQHHPSGVYFNSPPLTRVVHDLHLKWVKSCHQDARYLKFSDLRFVESCRADVRESTEAKNIKIVGEDAPEITASNVGFRMLQKMGWTPDALAPASNEGLGASPIKVVVRTGKTGLGFSY